MNYGDDDDLPPRKVKRRSEAVEDDEDRPRARSRRSRDDDEDEDDRRRRRRKKKRREPEGDGPWLISLAAAAACTFVSFVLSILFNGLGGLPPAVDGLLVKVGSLGFGLLVGAVLVGMGTLSVKNRVFTDRWGVEVRGTIAVVGGMSVAAIGGALCGFILYGLFFTVIHGQ
jgi:hypothetical protein